MQLEKCPLCESSNVRAGTEDGGRVASFVDCGTCGCSTGYYATEEEAAAAWNARPAALRLRAQHEDLRRKAHESYSKLLRMIDGALDLVKVVDGKTGNDTPSDYELCARCERDHEYDGPGVECR